MKSWSWLAIAPAVLTMAYFSAPLLVDQFAGDKLEPVAIEQVDLPRGFHAGAVKEEMRFAAFGIPPEALVLSLQSILVSAGGGVAVINGRTYRMGETVGGSYRIVGLAQREVLLASFPDTDSQSERASLTLPFPAYVDGDMGQPAGTGAVDMSVRHSLPVASGTGGAALPALPPDLGGEGKDYRKLLENLKL